MHTTSAHFVCLKIALVVAMMVSGQLKTMIFVTIQLIPYAFC